MDMKPLLIILSLLLFASCDPCKRMAKPKYRGCFNVKSDTLTLHDTFSIHDTVIVPQTHVKWLIQTDTVVETQRMYYSRQGDTTVIICKEDTIYRTKTVVRHIKVPYEKYVYKERSPFWLKALVILGIIIILVAKLR